MTQSFECSICSVGRMSGTVDFIMPVAVFMHVTFFFLSNHHLPVDKPCFHMCCVQERVEQSGGGGLHQ